MAALLLATTINPRPQVFIGVPTWSNTLPLFQHVGLDTVTYPYTDPVTKRPDLASCLQTIRGAPRGSIFAFQGCCHNPTGADLTAEQWWILGRELMVHHHVAVLDVAYQGLGAGFDEDAVAPRVFCELGLEVLVCQSFSKNFALYGERCGVLHVLARKVADAERVQDKLRSLVRSEYSSSPAYGSRLVKLVLDDEYERAKW
jgi:aspartate aminotransferase